jgi:hypothetical protein
MMSEYSEERQNEILFKRLEELEKRIDELIESQVH